MRKRYGENMIKTYFKDFKKLREAYGLKLIDECSKCNKKFELNSGVFFTKDGKVICKECYKKVSKQEK